LEELKPTTPEEYRRGKTKNFRVPSGAVFKIRKMTMGTVASFFETLGLSLPSSGKTEEVRQALESKLKEPEAASKIINAIHVLLPDCIVEPKVTVKSGADSLSVDEIEPQDQFALFAEIMDFGGWSEEVIEARRKFR